jgi:cell division protein FtsN
MPRDYRKRTGSRSYKSAPSSSFGWVVFGILIGVFLAVILYWKLAVAPRHHQHDHVPAATVHPQPAAAATHVDKKPNAAPASTAPEFDFYTVLPKMQVTPNQAPAAAPPSPPPVRPPAAPVAAETNQVSPATIPAGGATASATASTAAPTVVAPAAVEKPKPHPASKPALAVTPATPALAEKKAAAAVAMTEKKAPATKNTTDTAASHYLLQMGSLKSYAEADRLKAELTIMGFDVYIQPYKANGQIYNRVVMGPYASKQAALQQQAQLKKSGTNGVLVKVP